MPRPDDCPCTLYRATYAATRRALSGDAARGLLAVAEAVEHLAGGPALIAHRAALDAFSRAPMRSRTHICGLRLIPKCTTCDADE